MTEKSSNVSVSTRTPGRRQANSGTPPQPRPSRRGDGPEPPGLPQYSLPRILGTWAAAALPMGVLAWVAAPWLAHALDGPSAWPRAIVASPEMKKRFAELGVQGVGSSAQEFSAFLKAETTKWAEVIRTAGIRMD